MTPDYRLDTATQADVLHHLMACDAAFTPPLSARVDLDAYAAKLTRNAALFEAWTDSRLIGLVAVYLNAPGAQTAFVTNVSVDPVHSGQGIARHLMQSCITTARAHKTRSLSLEVDKNASAALHLYAKLGFTPSRNTPDGPQTLTLDLSKHP